MKSLLIAITLLTLGAYGSAWAEGDLSRQNVVDVALEMGTSSDGMYFKPSTFEFETGKAYRLIVTNVDQVKHELALNEMGERIFTRKIEVSDADGNLVTEVKGTIREVEVGPGKTVQWFFVPVQPTEGPVEVTCEIPGHREAGMRASAVIR